VADQLRELAAAGIVLALPDRPRRCGVCNGTPRAIDGKASRPPNAPDPVEQPVWHCLDCGQHFWRASHWDDVAPTLAAV
jgi:uncharacterized protein with PIN domain